MSEFDKEGLNDAERYAKNGYGDDWSVRSYTARAVTAAYWSGRNAGREEVRRRVRWFLPIWIIVYAISSFVIAVWGS